MTNVLVTGATGLLGGPLVKSLRNGGYGVISVGNRIAADFKVDLASYEQTALLLDKVCPEVIVNLVALTDVDRCEANPHEAYLHNVKPVENLANWILKSGANCHLIQISSDQVYDGLGPHAETDVTIVNQYAMSKLAGEFAAGKVKSTILRTNFVGKSMRLDRVSLTDWLFNSLVSNETINVFEDLKFSPLSMDTLCGFIERCIAQKPLGIFNVGSRDGISKADFAFYFADALGLPTANLKRTVAVNGKNLLARRPTDMRLQCNKFQAVTNTVMPRLEDEIGSLAGYYKT